jgi:alginate O-acetyltransferase complex protein AlgI
MLFNSIDFAIFFPILFVLYWLVANKDLRYQNALLLLASYFFYAWADWRFLFFLIASSALNFILGIYIEKTASEKKRRWLVYIGLLQGVGGLAFFKYYNFFITSFNQVFAVLHLGGNLQTLNILVPLGISFFTFRTISYILDVDKGKIEATKDWVIFFNYVAFFPSLLSGPIDKAKTFIPQLEKIRVFDYNLAKDGMRQILWGLFKKVVIANNCAAISDPIFSDYQNLPASSLWYATFVYTIQIYADFSGYSDMAIGFSKLLGFKITKNFDYPYFAQNIAEYWRKWHMSLTAWLTEYVFTPLSISFRDYGTWGLIMAIVINFVVVGIWHGANWTYVLFGFLHGCYFIPLILKGTMNKKKKIAKGKLLPSLEESFNVLKTFLLVMLTFIVFRAPNISEALHFFTSLFSKSAFTFPTELHLPLILLIAFFMGVEWLQRENDFGLQTIGNGWKKLIRWTFYATLLLLVYYFSIATSNQQFIYFQF